MRFASVLLLAFASVTVACPTHPQTVAAPARPHDVVRSDTHFDSGHTGRDANSLDAVAIDASALGTDAQHATPMHREPFAVASASNLSRLGTLTERQRHLLETEGFFLAPAPSHAAHGRHLSAAESYAAQPATHLFHVYERNDYIRFPSFVTVDVGIDATHAYFDALLRDLESRNLVPMLRVALRGLVLQSERLRSTATTPGAQSVAARVETYWGVALRLLDQPASGDAPEREAIQHAFEDDGAGSSGEEPVRAPTPVSIPSAVRTEVLRLVGRVQAAQGPEDPGVTHAEVDFSQMRPRGHYGRTGVLQRFFRAMSWLGMVSFPVEGAQADVEAVALMARSALGAEPARRGLQRIVDLTSYFVGGPDSSGLEEVCTRLEQAMPTAATSTADAVLATDVIDRYRTALATLPAPRIASGAGQGARQIRAAGRRAFEDSVAMQLLIAPVTDVPPAPREAIPTVFGALGAAAVLGSDAARDLVRGALPDRTTALDRAITRGRADIASVPATRWDGDGYHGTLHALQSLLDPRPANAPSLVLGDAWRQRALYAFAGGWAELRHDTILYGEQLGAECDAGETPPPSSYVEPVPEVFERLAAMVRGLDRRLRDARIPMQRASEGSSAPTLAAKTQLILSILDLLHTCAAREVRGEPLTTEQLNRLTTIGGEIEWLLITLANTDMLSDRDRQMAIVADVFTWRPTGEAVEVGIANPDLIYAVVPSPRGPVIARGAVMSYREFMQPIANRLTDEAWRRMLTTATVPARPAWIERVYAEPVRAISLTGEGVQRCGPSSGAALAL